MEACLASRVLTTNAAIAQPSLVLFLLRRILLVQAKMVLADMHDSISMHQNRALDFNTLFQILSALIQQRVWSQFPHRPSNKHLLGERAAAAGIFGNCSFGLHFLAIDDMFSMLHTTFKRQFPMQTPGLLACRGSNQHASQFLSLALSSHIWQLFSPCKATATRHTSRKAWAAAASAYVTKPKPRPGMST